METTSGSLLERVKSDDQESWCCLVRLYTPLVLWWCRRRGLWGPRAPDAQDVTQEVFKVVALKIKTFTKDGRPGAFRRWLSSITDRKLWEYWRQDVPLAAGGSSARDLFAQIPAEDSHEAEEPSERILVIRGILAMIRPRFEARTWEAAWQVIVEGRYVQDVADVLGMKVGSVYTAKSRVLNCLRKEYEGLLT